jgi:hypothetical protein
MATKTKAGTNGVKAGKTESWTDDPQRAEKNGKHLETMEAAAAEAPAVVKAIELPRLDIREITIKLKGLSPLICHAWSKKAREQILNKQMGKASAGKIAKDPEQDYQDSLYHLEGGGHGFPTIAFKNAAVSACTSLGKSVTKVQARQAFHVIGEMARIEGTPRRREDMVRVGMGVADVRFRAEFPEWSVNLTIRYNARVLTDEQITNLFNTAGFAVGVGEWRSERDGSFGLFEVATD